MRVNVLACLWEHTHVNVHTHFWCVCMCDMCMWCVCMCVSYVRCMSVPVYVCEVCVYIWRSKVSVRNHSQSLLHHIHWLIHPLKLKVQSLSWTVLGSLCLSSEIKATSRPPYPLVFMWVSGVPSPTCVASSLNGGAISPNLLFCAIVSSTQTTAAPSHLIISPQSCLPLLAPHLG